MKKIIFVAAIFLSTCMMATAQSPEWGIKGGVDISSLKVSSGTDYSSRTGFYVGGLAHMHFSKYFALQPELVFSSQGGKAGNVVRRLDYINLPVLFQYMTGNGLRLQTGPQLGFLVSGKNQNGNVEVDINDQLKSTDVSWAFGLSYITKSGLGLDGRYNLGISNINDNNNLPSARNSVFQLGAFYQFLK